MGRGAVLLLITMAIALLMASGVALALPGLIKTCQPGSTAAKPCYGGLYDDVITGWDPVLNGFNGSDYINAQNGEDYVEALGATDTVYGSLGPDHIYGDYDPKNWEDKNIAHGNDYGDDRLYGDNGDDWLYGGPGNDRLDGSTDNDHLYGDDGNDTLYGSIGIDTLNGGPGCDILYGSIGNDTINADDEDPLCPKPDTDTEKIDDKVYGEDGDDTIDAADRKKDIVSCGGGIDTVTADAKADGSPLDQLSSCEKVTWVKPDDPLA